MLINSDKNNSVMGESVASEMSSILESSEHINLFKLAGKKDIKEKLKKDKKEDKEDKKSKKKEEKAKKKLTSKSMTDIVNMLKQASETLDLNDLEQESTLVLEALNTLVNEISIKYAKFAPPELSNETLQEIELAPDLETSGLEDFEEDPDLAKLMNLGKEGYEDPDQPVDPLTELELMNAVKDVEYVDDEMGVALAKLDQWIEKNAEIDLMMSKDDELPSDLENGFSYEASLSEPVRITDRELKEKNKEYDRLKKIDPKLIKNMKPAEQWVEYKELSPYEKLEQSGADLQEQLDIDLDTMSDEEAYPELYEELLEQKEEDLDSVPPDSSYADDDDQFNEELRQFLAAETGQSSAEKDVGFAKDESNFEDDE